MSEEEKKPRKTTTMTITIYEDQKRWLKDNDDVNFSGLIRKKLDEIISEREFGA